MSKKLILGVLGTLFKMPEVEVAELLKKSDGSSDELDEDKALQLIIDKDKARIQALNDAAKTKFDDGYKKAQKESMEKLEKSLKTKYGIDEELQGEELIEAILTAKVTEVQKQSGKKELTEDEIKKLPVFLNLEKTLRKAVDDAKAEGEAAVTKLKEEYSQKETFTSIRDKAISYFKSKNPILSEDPIKADTQVNNNLIAHLNGYKYQDNNGQLVILKPDGTRLEDGHGHPMTLNALVDEISGKAFDFKAAEDRKQAGNGGSGGSGGSGGAGGKKYSGKAPTSAKEYADTLLSSDLSLEEKDDFKSTYGEQFSG
ncbi:MAG TPA: hypothetical protein VJ552_05370 [Sediminibacterium sp.]|nr:hypothetical protein [Sediminibacterium sp.]